MPGSEARREGVPAGARLRYYVRQASRSTARDETIWLLVMLCLTFVVLVLLIQELPWMPITAFAVPLLAGSLLLERLRFWILTLVIMACIAATLGLLGATGTRLGAAVSVVVLAVLLIAASTRSRLGGRGQLGESMLIDLRDRLRSQSELPELPSQWYAQAIMRSAGGAQFAGDFIVAAKTNDDAVLEVAVVDVSGKGLGAGTQALLLSGAFGGLLGAVSPDRFLVVANDYLLRQDWDEGFATAIHLALWLDSGCFEIRSAGHPPGVQWHAGSGRWQVHESSGAALGLVADSDLVSTTGQLDRGDALMLYTDGLVEKPGRDVSLGIDRLIGEAERMVRHGWENSAQRILDRIDVTGDDRAIFFLNRH